MGVAGSLPSPVALPSENNTQNITSILNEQTLPLCDDCSNDMMSISYDIISGDKSNTNINNDITIKNEFKIQNDCPKPKRYTIVCYGPISVRVSHKDAPTLKTGRLSKFIPLEGEAAIKRDLRRQKNRATARKLKEKRICIERQLENEINELESNKKDLVQEIKNLESYKQFLEKRYQQQILTTDRSRKQTRKDSCPSSPQWQLLLGI